MPSKDEECDHTWIGKGPTEEGGYMCYCLFCGKEKDIMKDKKELNWIGVVFWGVIVSLFLLFFVWWCIHA